MNGWMDKQWLPLHFLFSGSLPPAQGHMAIVPFHFKVQKWHTFTRFTNTPRKGRTRQHQDKKTTTFKGLPRASAD